MYYRLNVLNIPRLIGTVSGLVFRCRRTGRNHDGHAKPGPVSSPDRYVGTRSPGERYKFLQAGRRGN